LFRYYLLLGHSVEYARSVAVTGMVMIEAFYLLNCRFLYRGIFHRRSLQNTSPVLLAILGVVLLQLGFCYLPPLQAVFAVEPISGWDWIVVTAGAGLVVILVEIEKLLFVGKPISIPADSS